MRNIHFGVTEVWFCWLLDFKVPSTGSQVSGTGMSHVTASWWSLLNQEWKGLGWRIFPAGFHIHRHVEQPVPKDSVYVLHHSNCPCTCCTIINPATSKSVNHVIKWHTSNTQACFTACKSMHRSTGKCCVHACDRVIYDNLSSVTHQYIWRCCLHRTQRLVWNTNVTKYMLVQIWSWLIKCWDSNWNQVCRNNMNIWRRGIIYIAQGFIWSTVHIQPLSLLGPSHWDWNQPTEPGCYCGVTV